MNQLSKFSVFSWAVIFSNFLDGIEEKDPKRLTK